MCAVQGIDVWAPRIGRQVLDLRWGSRNGNYADSGRAIGLMVASPWGDRHKARDQVEPVEGFLYQLLSRLQVNQRSLFPDDTSH